LIAALMCGGVAVCGATGKLAILLAAAIAAAISGGVPTAAAAAAAAGPPPPPPPPPPPLGAATATVAAVAAARGGVPALGDGAARPAALAAALALTRASAPPVVRAALRGVLRGVRGAGGSGVAGVAAVTAAAVTVGSAVAAAGSRAAVPFLRSSVACRLARSAANRSLALPVLGVLHGVPPPPAARCGVLAPAGVPLLPALPAVPALLRAAACRRALARSSAGESGIYACGILAPPTGTAKPYRSFQVKHQIMTSEHQNITGA